MTWSMSSSLLAILVFLEHTTAYQKLYRASVFGTQQQHFEHLIVLKLFSILWLLAMCEVKCMLVKV